MMAWLGLGDRGALVDEEEAALSIFDHGLTVGDGIFETLKITPTGPFAVRRHLDRLHRSARAIGLVIPDAAVLRDAVNAVWQANRADLGACARLRITVTAGHGPLGSDRGGSQARVIIAAAPQRPWPTTAALRTVPWTRNERGALAGVKSTSYAENVVALAYAREHGADEGIFLNTRGDLCEGTSTNIFIVRDGVVVTPPLESGCLAGVTRELVLEWCDVSERVIELTEAHSADEVFITSSTRDVQPVAQWDDVTWGAPGPVTVALMAEFTQRAGSTSDP